MTDSRDSLDHYLNEDHPARFRTAVWAIGAGVLAALIAESQSSPQLAAVVCAVVASAVEIARALLFTGRPIEYKPIAPRRQAIRGLVAGLCFLVLSFLRIPRLEAKVVKRKLQALSADPSDPASAAAATKILEAARLGEVKVDDETIRNAGLAFIRTTRETKVLHAWAAAWDAACSCVGYRTFLNVDSTPPLTLTIGKSMYRPAVTININPSRPIVGWKKEFTVSFAGGHAEPETSARLERLDDPEPEGSEYEYFILDGQDDTVVLDGAYMRNVILRHCRVAYNGGQVRLENVYCVDCTFGNEFRLTTPARFLGEKLLGDTAIFFKFVDA